MEQLTILLPLVLCLSVLHLIQGFLQPPLPEGVKNELPFVSNGIDPGQPLYLTPLIEQGKYDEAQRASLVGHLDGTSLKSYAGLITVNKTYNSNMFFWFFPSQKDPMNDPVLLWLQGGPGRSSLFGLFVEIGPFSVDKKIKLVNRNVTWHKQYSVLYIDNPVGGGFSFTENDKGYSTNQVEVGINLYSCLTQFFMAFYQYQKNDFYVTGESYAGKFIPAISYRIYLENPTAKVKINFKGLAMGNSWTDPQTMIPSYASFLYSLGLLDENQRAYFQNTADKAVADIIDEKYMDAFYTFQSLLGGDLFASYFYKCTGMKYYYNFMLTEGPSDFYYHATYLTQPEVRRALHVGNLTYSISNDKAYRSMWPDFMHTVKPWVATLLDNNIKVMFYNGQLDIMVPGQVTEAILPTIKWSGQDKYLNVTRLIWKVTPHHKDIAGFVRQADNLYQVIVRGAGHILPYDQPERGLDMITRFVENLSFS